MNTPPLHRRQLLALLAAGTAPAFVRHARAADVDRFALGIASGQPGPRGMVLWTMLKGPDLPEAVPVRWEVAEDEAFTRIAARGEAQAVAADHHSVHAEPATLQPDRWYFYRFQALGQTSSVGRTRTAPAPDAAVRQLDWVITSCQRYDVGHYAAWRHAAAESLDLVMFLGDYIYEYGAASPATAVRRMQGGRTKTLADYRARHALHKSDPALQAAHAACPWLLVWDDHEVENDYAGWQGEFLQADFIAQRTAAYQAYWEHMPLAHAARPQNGWLRLVGRLDWGRLARIHLLDDRQYRDAQVCPKPGRGGSHTVRVADCPSLLDPKRTLLGAEQEAWLASGWSLDRPWNLVAQQTLMARWTWEAPSAANGGGQVWTDGWEGYPAARERLLRTVAERRVPGCVVLGGDVHANYVADLKLDFADEKAAPIASEFCGTSITSLGLEQSRLDAALSLNPHVHHARADRRGYVRLRLQAGQLQADLRSLDDARDAASAIRTEARFAVEAARPGIQRA